MRKKTDEGKDELIEAKWGLNTKTFRTALIILVLSMHPLGRQIIKTFGFQFPDEQKLTVAAEESKGIRNDVDTLKADVKELKETSQHVTANNLIINSKLDKLDTSFTNMQSDFQKYRFPAPTLNQP